MDSLFVPFLALYEQDSIEKHLYWSTPLVHTEGCGEGYGKQSIDGMSTYDRIACGHLLHPHVYCGFLVEHGCEKTLLTYFTSLLKKKYNTDINDFGMASVQKDCGIHNTINKACNYLFPTITSLPNPEPVENVPIKGLVFGFLTKSETVSSNYIRMAANTINAIVFLTGCRLSTRLIMVVSSSFLRTISCFFLLNSSSLPSARTSLSSLTSRPLIISTRLLLVSLYSILLIL